MDGSDGGMAWYGIVWMGNPRIPANSLTSWHIKAQQLLLTRR